MLSRASSSKMQAGDWLRRRRQLALGQGRHGGLGDPSSIPGLVMWADISSIVPQADGTRVAAWPDKAGQGATISQATTLNQPKYHPNGGDPYLEFAGTYGF